MTHAITFSSTIFPVETVQLDGTAECVVAGGRQLFPLVPKALRGIDEIAVLGWGPQARAQACNLRDTLALAGSHIRVAVGLREGSRSADDARAAGFTEQDGTLGGLFDVAGRADLVLLLISDAAQVELHERLFETLTPGSTLGLSHGFLIGHLEGTGMRLPSEINVIGVCPKGMGPSVRRLYEQGAQINGAGINASFAVEQDVDGWATDIALAWAIAIGAPYTFKTTLREEYRSDIFGERGVLLGAVHGIVESRYRHLRDADTTDEDAFVRACETLTGPIARTISRDGIIGVYDALADADRGAFATSYTASYGAFAAILHEIYDEVSSGRELAGVVAAGGRLDRFPMPTVEGTPMWKVGAGVRRTRGARRDLIDPTTAGIFCAAMVAQVDVLREHGHAWSEVANESVIEAVDSLLPYMHARGVAYMVDNCSTTARLGARRWGPIFEAGLDRVVYPAIAQPSAEPGSFRNFVDHPVHGVLRTLSKFRPPLDIAVA